MAREEEMGILIELVSVRDGVSSKGWRTTESFCVGRHVCAGADSEPSGAREHSCGFLCGHMMQNLPLGPGSPAGLSYSISSPAHPGLCLPAHKLNQHPNKPFEMPQWVGEDQRGVWVDPCLLLLPSCWCHLSPVPFIRSPSVFACEAGTDKSPRQVLVAFLG